MASLWVCPTCGRRVPQAVDACRCGTSRPNVLPLTSIVVVVVLALGAALAIDRAMGVPPAPSPAPPIPSPEVAPARPAPVRPRAAVPENTEPPAPILAPSLPPPSPRFVLPPVASAPSPSPEDSSLDNRRAEGVRLLHERLNSLSRAAHEFMDEYSQFQKYCSGASLVSGRASDCHRLGDQISKDLSDLGSGYQAAQDEARQNWVEPGAIRTALKQHGIDEDAWDRLSKEVRDSLKNQ